MIHSESHIDKITGVNDTLRGERTAQETAEGRTILKESALTRNEGLFRMNERVGQKVFNWLIQFLYVFTPEEGQRVYGAEIETGTDQSITRDMLKGVKILCYVKDGSTIPVDKTTIQTQAIERFKLGLYSKVDTLKKLEDADAEGIAYRRFLEETAPQVLYDPAQSLTAYEPEAVMHIYEILMGRDAPALLPQDLQKYEKHMQTNQAYLDGKPIDEDIPFIKDLDGMMIAKLQAHFEEEAQIYSQMVAEAQMMANQPPAPEPIPEPSPDEVLGQQLTQALMAKMQPQQEEAQMPIPAPMPENGMELPQAAM